MQEKDMVNDVLSMVNSSLTSYANIIAQTSNQQLRQMLQQTRDADEQFQYRLYQIAEQKGYYNRHSRLTHRKYNRCVHQLHKADQSFSIKLSL